MPPSGRPPGPPSRLPPTGIPVPPPPDSDPPEIPEAPPEAVSISDLESAEIQSSHSPVAAPQSSQQQSSDQPSVGLSISMDDSSSSEPIQLSSALETSGAVENSPPPPPTPTPAPKAHNSLLHSKPGIKPTLKVQTTVRKAVPTAQLFLWEPDQLSAGTDPMGKGILHLLKNKAQSALFLAIAPPAPGTQVPLFVSTAAVVPQQKLNIWQGLRWSPSLTPDVWKQFLQTAWVEFAPPGGMTVQSSNRNLIRTAFGILPTEWLTLYRIGPPDRCRGVIAMISKESLMVSLTQVLPLFAAPPPKK